jgi:hypothetical protein
VKIWHDDARRPPDGSWSWACTNAEAIALLEQGDVDEISLDRDIFKDGRWHESGELLIKWMIERERVPALVRIHSWNLPGARRMVLLLNRAGYSAEYGVADP